MSVCLSICMYVYIYDCTVGFVQQDQGLRFPCKDWAEDVNMAFSIGNGWNANSVEADFNIQ